MPILSPREYQIETIRALERAKPPLVIRHSPQEFDVFDGIDNSIRAQAVAAYIDDHYTYARSTRGVEIWRRRTRRAAAESRRLPAPHPHPDARRARRDRRALARRLSLGRQPARRERRVLAQRSDAAQSVQGARCRSALRYVAGDVRIDRAVTILGGQTLRWEDVVKIALPRARGQRRAVDRIPRAAPPVALLKTYDAAHNAQGSVDAPLSMRDSATAGTDNADLTIVGIPGGTQRRVNLGIVNVGKIPATFRITVRTRTGQQIGKPFEEALGEDASRMIADIDKTLGVAIDETTAVHVTMIAGTGVAYVSIVNANGDSQFLPAIAVFRFAAHVNYAPHFRSSAFASSCAFALLDLVIRIVRRVDHVRRMRIASADFLLSFDTSASARNTRVILFAGSSLYDSCRKRTASLLDAQPVRNGTCGV